MIEFILMNVIYQHRQFIAVRWPSLCAALIAIFPEEHRNQLLHNQGENKILFPIK
jgi:hypothetical protein